MSLKQRKEKDLEKVTILLQIKEIKAKWRNRIESAISKQDTSENKRRE